MKTEKQKNDNLGNKDIRTGIPLVIYSPTASLFKCNFFGAAVQQFTRFRLTRGVAIAQLLVRRRRARDRIAPPTGNTTATTGRDGGTPEEKPIRGTAV